MLKTSETVLKTALIASADVHYWLNYFSRMILKRGKVVRTGNMKILQSNLLLVETVILVEVYGGSSGYWRGVNYQSRKHYLTLLKFISKVSWIQRSTFSARASRHRICGVWKWMSSRSCSRCSPRIQDNSISCHENHLC